MQLFTHSKKPQYNSCAANDVLELFTDRGNYKKNVLGAPPQFQQLDVYMCKAKNVNLPYKTRFSTSI